jgi:hypothetical protein
MTLRKPSVSLPRLRLGHITGGYTLGLTPRHSGRSPLSERRISASRYTTYYSDSDKKINKYPTIINKYET